MAGEHEHEWYSSICMVDGCDEFRPGRWEYCGDGCCGEFIPEDD